MTNFGIRIIIKHSLFYRSDIKMDVRRPILYPVPRVVYHLNLQKNTGMIYATSTRIGIF